MRNLLTTTFLVVFTSICSFAQPCSGLGGTQTGNDVIFCSSSEPLTETIFDIPAGNYALVYVCSANTYTFTTCNNLYLGNAEISVLDEFGGVITGAATDYINDNTCGTSGNDETLVWTPPAAYAGGGFVQVVVTQYDDILMNPCQNIGLNADLEITASGTCAPPGSCCENPDFVSGATYNATGLTTCGLTNEFDNSSACGSFYLDGPEYVLEFTPSSTTCYTIDVTGTGAVGVFVLDACSAGASCEGSAESDTGTPSVSLDLIGGVPYTILISTDPAIGFGNTPCTDFDIDINSCSTGSVCSVAEAVTAPYDSGPTSTCGSGDDYDETDAAGCSANDFYLNGDDYVYTFTPVTTSCYTLDLENQDNWMGLLVFDACPDGPSTCVGTTAGGTVVDPINLTLNGGTTYYIVVSSNPAGVSPPGIQCGSYQLTIDECPVGTDCGNPFMIADGPFPVNIAGETTCGLGDDFSTTNCADDNYIDGEDMVFTFSPSMAGCYNIALTAEAYSSVLVLDDCPTSGGACIGWAGSAAANPELDVTLNAGTTYYIIVSSWPLPDCLPTFDLTIDMCPPGSVCSDPFVIPSAPYSVTGGTTCGFGDDYSTSPCGDNNYIDGEDYVMEFTPVTSGCYTLDFTNTDTYLGVFVWDDCPATNGTQCLGFAGETGNATSLDQYLEAGNTYYFIVSTWPAPDCSNFDFSLTECADDGEDCSTPVTLITGVSQNLSTCGMGDNYDDSDACGSSFMNGDDIVFEFTPGSDGCFDIVLSGASEATADFGLFILDDCPDSPSAICEAQGTGVASTPTVTANLIGGMTYTIVVASSICSDFTIVANSVTCPAGADCANPETVNLGSNGSFDTTGAGDDYETTDACGGAYMGGTDFVMEFTAPADDCYNFTTSAGIGFNPAADVGLFILDGCPDVVGTNCLAFDEVMDGFPMVDAYLIGGNTYTIVVGVVEFTGPVIVNPSNTVFDLEITSGGSNCPSGINCGNPINLTAPGLYSDLTNCGFASDYDNTDGCMDIFMFGEETVFTFTPGATDCYDIITSPTASSDPANDDVGLFVLTDCPDIPSADCILNETMENGFPSGSVQLEAGETYYIIVSAIDLVGATAFVDCADFNLEIIAGSTSCPSDCSNADEIFLGMNTGFSSCGAGDDYSEADIEASCGNSLDFYMNSEESVMTFTPGSSGCYIFETSNGSNFDADPALFILDACPDDGPSCVAIGVDENDMPAITAQLNGGQTYYIVFSAIEIISNSGGVITYGPSCTDFDIEISQCPPQAPVQDCNGAIPVCQNTYSYTDGFLGGGSDPNEMPSGSCLLNGELNSVWFTVNVEDAGDLSFLITPNDASDDYDFAAFDITDNGCEGIPTGASPILSCNYSISAGVTGTAGPSMPGSPLNNQDAAGTLINPSIEVAAGQTIVVVVSNFSTSLTGFDIDFSASTANIVDTTPPDFDMITSTPSCDDTSLDITFNEPITCASILECDFTITYPDATVHGFSNVSSAECASGNFATDFTFDLDDPLDQNGTYTITLGSGCGGVDDNCGNVQDNTTIQFDIDDCATCSIDDIVAVDATCGMDNGEATVTITGTSPFTVVIDGNTETGPSPITVTGLSVGTHTVTVTDDNGCMTTGSVTINDTPGPTIDMITPTDATCGNTDGEAEVTITGNGDFTVTIDGVVVTGPSPITVTGLSPGTFAVDVEDINGCTTSGSVTIGEQESPTIDMVTSTNSTCGNSDGEATVTISGGSTPYTLIINGTTVSGDSPLTVTGLPSGTYDVDVTDANGCTDMSTVSISDDSGPTIDMITPTDATCGNTDGEAEVTITGNGDFTVTIDGVVVTGPSPITVTGLSPGTFAVDVEDINGCTTSGSVTIGEQESPTIDMVTSTNSTCGNSDGEATVTISGGSTPYTLIINGTTVSGNSPLTVTGLPSGTYDVDVTDANGCTDMSTVSISDDSGPTIDMITPTNATCGNTDGEAEVTITGNGDFTVTIDGVVVTGPSPVTVTGLSPGTFAVDVEDINGCTTSGSVTIGEQESPTIDMVTSTNSTCGNSDGEATVTISGGSTPYTLVINGTTVSGNSPLTVTGLPSGTYDVDVTDANGCTDMSTVSISDDSGPTIDMITPTNATCGNTDGEAEVTITGNGDFTVTIDGVVVTGPSPVTVTGLSPGTFAVDVEDINGCTTSGSVTIGEQESPTIDMVTSTNSTCGNSDGEATVTISGGSTPYTLVINGTTVSGNSPLTVTGLPSGTYDVDVTDANGCTDMSTVSISDDSGPTIDMITPTDATCGDSNGAVDVAISGGTAPYTVEINGEMATGDSPVTVSDLPAGTFDVNITDANGCMVMGSVTIGDSDTPVIDMITPTDATCVGSDGEAEVAISGGTAPYTVTINLISETGDSPITITGLDPGTYNVDVVDANGCTVTGLVTIEEQQSPVIDMIDVTNSTCGNADGEATVTISGGQAPYTVDIDSESATGDSPITVSNLAAGTYDVTVTDDNGCTTMGSVTISDDGGPVIDSVTPSNEVCGNGAGSAEVVISGGLAPYSVTIGSESETGDSPITINNLSAGTYSVDVVDDNGCMTSGTVTIEETPGPSISSVDITNEICDMANGSLTINVTDGTAPYTYDIGVGAPQVDDNTFIDLAAGTYNITVTDANGCTDEANATIDNIPGVQIDDTDITDASCGLDNGSVTISISGGNGPYSYDLSGTIQVNNGTFTDLAEGTYNLVVTDDNGCSATAEIIIEGSPSISITSVDPTDENCGNADGTATINISGGTAPVTYTLDGNAQIDDNLFTDLTAGTYDVTVTDANGCTDMSSVTIDEIAGPIIDDIISIDASCGQADGEATIIVSGGFTPYSYDLDGTIQADPNNSFTGLASGTYSIIVTDANGCTAMGTVNINDADGPTIDNVDITDATCGMATGSVTVTASGGSAPLTISLDGIVNGTNTFSDLLPGNYTVAVEDNNGCITTQEITIGDTPGVQIDDIQTTDATCGNEDGSKTIFFSGGDAPYSVTCGVNTQTTSDNSVTFDNLAAGTYSVIVTDANGCTDEATATINEANPPIINNIVVNDADCGMATGSITINASGDNPPLTFDIGSGPQASNVFTDLSPATYTIVVTDANGCTATQEATVNDIPGVQIDNIQTTDATCGNADGTKTINVSGGTPPYTYDCNGVIQVGNNVYTDLAAGTYTVIVTDAAGCTDETTATISDADGPQIINVDITDATCGLPNGEVTISANGGTAPYTYFVNGVAQASNVFTDLPSGDIVVLVEDANGCSVSQNEVIGDTPAVIIEDLIVTDADCGQSNGEVIIQLDGGTAPFTYSLDGISQTSNNTFIGLAAGTYPIEITDAQGCTTTGSVTVLDIPGVIIDDLTIIEASCGLENGSITVNTSGGQTPYSYQLDGGTPQPGNLFAELASGTYEVLVTDDNGCTSTATAVVNGTDGPAIDDIATTPSSCGQSDGSVTITATGGTTPYSYNLDGIIQNDPDNTFTGLASGNYPITVTDANGCTAIGTANVTDDGGASIDDVTVVDANCDMPNGSVTILASGGADPLTYLLNGNNSGSNVFDNLLPNTYNIEVIDNNGCITASSVVVNNIPGVQIDNITTTPENCGQSDGTKTISASGGNEPYTFECNGTIQTNGFFSNLSAGTYTVLVTDADGCVIEGSATIGEVEGPQITNIEPTNTTCGQPTGALVVNAINGTQPYSYDIGNGPQSNNQFNDLDAGTYSVTVTDDNGCSDIQEATINDSPGVVIDDVIITNSTCGQADGAKEVIISGGTAPFTFDCNGTVQDNGIFTNLPSGIYTVIVTDANGCTDMTTATISDADGPTIDDLTATPANCGNADGSITISISGGLAPYNVTAGGQTVSTSDMVTISNLPAGDTPVLVEDANGCQASASITIDSTPGVIIDDIIITNASCGQADGTKEVIISGGTGPFSFDCNGVVQDNGIFNNLPSGTYTVIVTDANGCTDMATATIMDADGPVIDSATATNADCGQDNGTVTINVSQGNAPYDITLDGNTQSTSGSATFTDLSPGEYTYDVVDASGCVTSGTIEVLGADNPVIDGIDVLDATCNNADGSLTVNVTGGTEPYSYDIGNGPQGSNTFENLASGIYTIIVTDANGCSDQMEATINDIGGPTITDITVVDASSAGNDGSITITATGGTAPYTFTVDGLDIIGDPTVTFDNLAAGTYPITVTDANGCSTSGTATIINGDCVTIDAINTNNAICDEDNGTITVFASGGVIPYMYSIDNGPLQSSNIFNGIGQGTYVITVSDDAGCTSTQSVEIVQNGSPSITNVLTVDATCGDNNGELAISATDGLPPYSYSVNGITFQDNASFSNLQANTYTVIVEDANGCQTTQEVTIDSLSMPQVDEIIITNATCGDMDGAATFVVTGAIGQVLYAINGGTFQISNQFNNLGAGAYTYQVLDNNCLVAGVFTVTNEGAPEITDIDITNASCNNADGQVTISINPGTAPHTYTLGSIVQIDNPTFTGLAAGDYTIVVQDANGCIGSTVFSIIEQGELDINILGNLFVCEGGFTELFADPTDQGYDFSWSIGGITTDNLLVTSENVGDITLTATKGDCIGTATVNVTLVPLPAADAGSTQELNCNNPSVTLDASASSGTDITYLWSTTDGNITSDPTSPTIDVNSAGTYQVLITESINGCSSIDVVVVTQANDVPNAEAGPNGILDCDNTTYTLNGMGSSQGSNYAYLWSGDNNQTIINPNTLTPTVSQIGTYTLQVTDTNSGCTAVDVVEVTSDGTLPSGLDFDVVNPDCFGDNNGSISILNVQGGQGPYQYSFGGGAFSDVTDFNGLTSGAYDIIVMAANGCQYTETVVIDDGIDLMVDLGPDQFIDFGDFANINASTNEDLGNIVDVQWSLSPEDEDLCETCMDQSLMPPVTTFYIIDITNDKGCTAQDNLTVFVHLEQTILTPNIFSPNGDNINDIFYITTEENVEAHINFMKIFDRWGNMVFSNENFEPNNPLEGWDGTWNSKLLNPAVFVYVIEVEFTLETEVRTQIFKGDITIKN